MIQLCTFFLDFFLIINFQFYIKRVFKSKYYIVVSESIITINLKTGFLMINNEAYILIRIAFFIISWKIDYHHRLLLKNCCAPCGFRYSPPLSRYLHVAQRPFDWSDLFFWRLSSSSFSSYSARNYYFQHQYLLVE